MPRILAVIPARFGSTRLPGKPLIDIAGKTLIERVYAQTKQASLVSEVVVATDDQRIYNHVLGFGGKVIMTSANHPTGTDRCVEVAEKLGDQFDVILNIQGDEPFIAPQQIDALATLFQESTIEIGTLAKLIIDPAEIFDPKEAKVVFNESNHVLYMSRSAIPYLKDTPPEQWHTKQNYYKHIGIYGFRTEVLSQIAQMPQTVLEKAESLEQLRWLDKFVMKIGFTDHDTLSIDTIEDLKEIEKYL